MKKVLVDSNIFLDYYLDRRDNLLPLGEFAFQFVEKALKCKYLLVICNSTLREISSNLGISEDTVWEKVLSGLKKKNKIELVQYSHEQVMEARIISKEKNVAFNDALFAIMARDKGILVVTRDWHFFEELSEIVGAVKPEELE